MYSRPDANQASIIQILEEVGATVQDLHEVGGGCPDILIGYKGVNYLAEIKTAKGKLNAKQVRWHRYWQGQKIILRSEADALQLIGVLP